MDIVVMVINQNAVVDVIVFLVLMRVISVLLLMTKSKKKNKV